MTNHLRREYIYTFNRIQAEWRQCNSAPFGNVFISDQLIQFILSRSALIKRLGQLYRELNDA